MSNAKMPVDFRPRLFVDRDRRTPAYVKAVDALRAVGDVDLAARAAAEATWHGRLMAWASREGLTPSKSHACVARLLGKRCPWSLREPKPGHPPCRPPGADHPLLWLRNGKPAVYTFEPYGMSLDTLRELVAFCDRWGLDLHISGWPAGWFPGATVWVELRVAGTGGDER